MIDRILVPLDGSLVAEQILPHLRRLLFRHDSEVILVRAAVPPVTEVGMSFLDDLVGAARSYLVKIQEGLVEQGARVRSVVRPGAPVGVILDVAEQERATMLALATHGETGLKRLLTGSVAEALLRKSPVPVLVVRPFWSYELLPARSAEEDLRPIRNILLPLDDTDDAKTLLPSLVELAQLYEARVVLLHVGGNGEGDESLSRMEQALKEEEVETLRVTGKGDPVTEILSTARAHEIDLIAMSTHGKSGLLGFLTGSVTEKVLHESTWPILVMRALARSEGQRKTTRSVERR